MSFEDEKPDALPPNKWYPGMTSPNPGGRPKSAARVKELAGQHTEEVIETLIGIVRNPKSGDHARIAAGVALMNRGHGVPAQTVDVELRESPRQDVNDDNEVARRFLYIVQKRRLQLQSLYPNQAEAIQGAFDQLTGQDIVNMFVPGRDQSESLPMLALVGSTDESGASHG